MADTQKALTKEDLIYILQALFKIADAPDNALSKTENGLYVKSYQEDLQAHKDDASSHITSNMREILNKITVDENDDILYSGKPISFAFSQEKDNALVQKPDGLYVKDYHADVHIEDEDIHVTKEKKEEWDATLSKAKQYYLQEIDKIPVNRMQVVTHLPAANIDSDTLYLLLVDDAEDKHGLLPYIYAFDKWWPCIMSRSKLEAIFQEDLHDHDNKDVLDLFGEDNGRLIYNGKDIFSVACKDDPTNAAKMVDGLLYIKDFSQELKALEICAAFNKVNLYSEEIRDSGKYQLKDSIDNYNLLLVEYYYKPDKEGEPNGCAKTAVIDVDIINELYQKNMDYMLEYGYGIMTSNSKIRMHDDKLWVDYYHNVCIYRITGIRKGEDDGGNREPDTDTLP